MNDRTKVISGMMVEQLNDTGALTAIGSAKIEFLVRTGN
jgi:hypothetical protein